MLHSYIPLCPGAIQTHKFIWDSNSICRVSDGSPHLDGNRKWAQQAQYNKFVREWVEELG